MSHYLLSAVTSLFKTQPAGKFLWGGALISFFSVVPCYGEVRDAFVCTSSVSAKEATKIVERLQREYEKVPRISALFSQQSYLAALDIAETSAGSVTFEKPGKMKWEYLQPSQQTFLVNGDTLWFYQPEDNQLAIDSFDQVVISELPVAFLLGLGNLARDFEVIKSCSTKDGVAITFKPRKGKKDMESADTSVDKAKSSKSQEGLSQLTLLTSEDTPFPQGAQVMDVGKNVTSIVLKNIVVEKEFTFDHFSPHFPPSVDTQDRRKIHE